MAGRNLFAFIAISVVIAGMVCVFNASTQASTAVGSTTPPWTVDTIPLSRASQAVIPLSGGPPVVGPVPNSRGAVIMSTWFDLFADGATHFQTSNSYAVRILVINPQSGTVSESTAVFLPDRWNNSDGQRCNTKDRVVRFDPPIVVQPGDTFQWQLLTQHSGDQLWSVAPLTDTVRIGLGYYLILPGEI